jgi:L,D-peptidoglycan transpeptidase YkuD (ErfK/YbiS/YcfS/YnhG family)
LCVCAPHPQHTRCSRSVRWQQSALPCALHSLGFSAVEIEGAMARRLKADKGAANTELMTAQTAQMVGDADVALKSAQTKKTEAEVAAVEAGVEKTQAEVGKVNADAKKAEHDARAPFASAAAAAAPDKPDGSSSSAKKK